MSYQFFKAPSFIYKHKLLILASAGLFFSAQCRAEATLTDKAISKLVADAESALVSGQASKAAELYEKAAAMGESAPAEIGLVRAYLESGEFRKAVSFANLVAAEHADVSETAALLAYLEDREGQTAPALVKLSEELKKNPDDVALLGANMEILLDRMAIPQALQQLDAWIERNPPQGDIYRLRARAALAAGNHTDLVKWRRKAAEAYEANGDMKAAQALRNWLSKLNENQSPENLAVKTTENSVVISTNQEKATQQSKSHWPSVNLEAFPLNKKTAIKSGNGFIIDQGRHVVTNANLVANAREAVWVRNGLGKIRQAQVEKILPDQGLALLRLKTPYLKEWSLPNQVYKVPDGVRFCFVLGFPITDDLEASYPIIAPGVVVRPDAGVGGLMQITASLGPENGGSAVFDGTGKFIGMTLKKQEPLKGITDRDALLGNGSFAVRADALQNLFPKAAVSAEKKQTKTKALTAKGTPSVEELYENLLPTVVTIVAPN